MKYSPKRRVIKIWGLFIYIFNDACNTFVSLIIFTLEIFFEERNQWLTDWDQSKTDCISSRHLTTELSVTLEHLLTIIWGFLLFRLYPFPTEKKSPEMRQKWKEAINRADPKKPSTLLDPSKDQRVCSIHFVDGKPTNTHPCPELYLGHGRKSGKRKKPFQLQENNVSWQPDTLSNYTNVFVKILY